MNKKDRAKSETVAINGVVCGSGGGEFRVGGGYSDQLVSCSTGGSEINVTDVKGGTTVPYNFQAECPGCRLASQFCKRVTLL